MDADYCEARHQGADTSKQAFQETSGEVRRQQGEMILGALELAGDQGMTCEELARYIHRPYTSCSARISKLAHDRKIHDGGERRKTSNDRDARVYRIGPPPAAPARDRMAELGEEIKKLEVRRGQLAAEIGAKVRELAELAAAQDHTQGHTQAPLF